MSNKYIIVSLLIMCTDCCGTDVALKNFKLNPQNIFKKTPKIWHNYIRIFIYRYLNNGHVEKFLVLTCLKFSDIHYFL